MELRDTIEGPRVHIEWSMSGGHRGDLNFILFDPSTGKPLMLSERNVDDAVFWMDYGDDPRAFESLCRFRDVRQRLVEKHFLMCARTLISSIEAKEEWSQFGM